MKSCCWSALWTSLSHLQRLYPSTHGPSPAGTVWWISPVQLQLHQWWHFPPILYGRPPEQLSEIIASLFVWLLYILKIIQSNSYHDLHISNTLKGVVNTAIGHLHQHLLDGPLVVFGINKLCSTKLLALFKLCRVNVHANNPSCPSNLAAHNNSQANSSKTKDGTGGTRLNLNIKKLEYWQFLHYWGSNNTARTPQDFTTHMPHFILQIIFFYICKLY